MNIFLVEDDEIYYGPTIDFLEHDGHKITHVETLEEALELIPNFDKLEIKVAILDGYIPNDKKAGLRDFYGRTIAEEIKKEFPTIVTVAYTNIPEEYAKYADIYVTKRPESVSGCANIGGLRLAIKDIDENKTPQA